IQFVQVVFGRPNCNGDVFHDVVLFKPFEPTAPESWSRDYTASSVSGCGTPAKTHVVYTRERLWDAVPQFPNTPPPKTEAAPSQGAPAASWLGRWAEDPMTPTPIIVVVIRPSHTASGSFEVEIVEQVDRRFGAT